jgi:hypothetical protein
MRSFFFLVHRRTLSSPRPSESTMGNYSSSTRSSSVSSNSTSMSEEKDFVNSEISAHEVVIFSKTYCGKFGACCRVRGCRSVW